MEGFCRGCLIKYDDPEELLEYTEKNRRLFIYSTGLQVKRNDTFTFQLCKDCYLNMKQSCKFKKLCRTSDKKLKTYLSLKESGDPVDLCTYLKNNDDNFSLRFPHWGGNSTPANQKRDDDNESTCTSIGNFMRDILQGTEMPDSEARIVRQVIEEEADILDESLDSHWLQDDVSIDTNFQLDFSFSPFSTPRSVNDDHCYTPRRQADQGSHYELPKVMSDKLIAQKKVNDNEYDAKQTEIKEYDIFSDRKLNKIGDRNYETSVKIQNFCDEKDLKKIENDLIVEEVDALSDSQMNQVNSKNYYIDNTLIEQTVNDVVRILEGKCVEENQTDITSILDDKSVRETQKAVASLFDGNSSKNLSESINIFDGKSGKGQMDLDSVLDVKGVSETQRAVATLLGVINVSENQSAVSCILDDKSSKNQAELLIISDGKGSKKLTETVTIFDGKSGKTQKEITSNFGKGVRENQMDAVDAINGMSEKNQTIFNIFDGIDKDHTVGPSLLEGKSIENQKDDIEQRLDDALKDENQEITLEDLLGPEAYPNTAVSTPTIHNIIFGDKLDDENSNQIKVGRTIEKYDNVQGDIDMLEELFDIVEIKVEPSTPRPTPQPEVEAASKTLTINVAENLSVNMSYTLPENLSIPKEITKPNKTRKNPIPDPDYEGIEIVDCICMICNKKFKDMRTLKLHSVKKHKVKLPKAKKKREATKLRICDYCGKEYTDKRNFIRHMKVHTKPKKVIECEKCGVTFETKAKYNKHRKTHLGHNPIYQAGDKVCCEICGRHVLRTSMPSHRRVHQKQYRVHCEDCGKGFYHLSDYRVHKLEHTGERPHQCEICGERFIRKSALVRHMRVHTGEKRFACDNCYKKYSHKVTLVKHIASGRCRDFKETGKLRIRQRPLRSKNTIQIIKVMTEEELARKPFECIYCHTRHRSENVLIRHQRISKACKEIQSREIAPTQAQPEDLSQLKSLEH